MAKEKKYSNPDHFRVFTGWLEKAIDKHGESENDEEALARQKRQVERLVELERMFREKLIACLMLIRRAILHFTAKQKSRLGIVRTASIASSNPNKIIRRYSVSAGRLGSNGWLPGPRCGLIRGRRIVSTELINGYVRIPCHSSDCSLC
jgi:hypothetical protein